MKKSLSIMMLSMAILSSCEPMGEDGADKSATVGTFILNNGTWGGNDSEICVFNPLDGSCVPDAFSAANGQKLGDLAPDILRLDDEVYIAVSGSQTIFVTDTKLKIKTRINAEHDGAGLSPRALTSDGKKIYVSYYEGFVGEISPEDHSCRLTKVGPNPEGLDICGDRLYVADSGGMAFPDYGSTISIVSLSDFTRTDTLEVNVNPVKVAAYDQRVYIFSYGDYAAVPALLQVYDTSDGSLKTLEYESVSSMAEGEDGILYLLCCGHDENWNTLPGHILMHDMSTDTPLGEFVTDGTELPNAYSISAAADGNIYVGCSDYITTGEVCVFSKEGRLLHRFDSGGFNPIAAE